MRQNATFLVFSSAALIFASSFCDDMATEFFSCILLCASLGVPVVCRKRFVGFAETTLEIVPRKRGSACITRGMSLLIALPGNAVELFSYQQTEGTNPLAFFRVLPRADGWGEGNRIQQRLYGGGVSVESLFLALRLLHTDLQPCREQRRVSPEKR